MRDADAMRKFKEQLMRCISDIFHDETVFHKVSSLRFLRNLNRMLALMGRARLGVEATRAQLQRGDASTRPVLRATQ